MAVDEGPTRGMISIMWVVWIGRANDERGRPEMVSDLQQMPWGS
jgi:hypothetical protein